MSNGTAETALTLTEGTEFTTADQYDVAVKASAYDLFLHTDMDPVDIAIRLNVPRHAVLRWFREGKWNDRKHELEIEAFRACESRYRRFVMDHKLPTVERHMKTARMIEDQIQKLLVAAENGDPLDSTVLRRLAEALSSSSSVSARAIGMSDKGLAAADAEGEGGGGDGKRQPLVVVVREGPRVSAPAEPRTIEAESEWRQ